MMTRILQIFEWRLRVALGLGLELIVKWYWDHLDWVHGKHSLEGRRPPEPGMRVP